ncbi:M48 family metallopeptidase [Bartonella sp. HY406]|uniref:M48 family metallopeptidase n=1 Tax=Bartonella sp. HY406 TaxID=2979331 RepID=UPI0021C7304F|nr:SprT family zinc-dependent metalloprotease [Bartonella sp. HY406]UXN05112.1 M48 family metallopeptidase [Bartonella sp. HY406]
MMLHLFYGDQKISYEIRRNLAIKNRIRIHVQPDGLVIVEAPESCELKDIQNAVFKKARWIKSKLDEFKRLKRFALPRQYVSGETHFYLGRRYQLKVIEESGQLSKITIKSGYIHVQLPYKDPLAVKRRLMLWYKNRALSYLQKRLDTIAADIYWIDNVPSIKLVNMRTQWGNCSPQGQLNLNPMLIKAPRECIDYVLTHELCHLREHNHSKRFYALMDDHLPNWEKIKIKLDDMAELLLA